jgi:hypothetical protein
MLPTIVVGIGASGPRRMASAALQFTVLVMLLLGSCTLLASAQTRPAVVTVSKSRFWVPDVFRNFRMTNASAPRLPKYAIPLVYPRLSRHSAVYDEPNQRLVVFGGDVPDIERSRRPSNLATNDVLQYDIRTNRWYGEKPFTRAPLARHDHIAWMNGAAMWVHGGKGDKLSYSDVWTYRNRTWVRFRRDGPRLAGHTANWVSSRSLWVFGGLDDRVYTNRLYNAFNGTFTEVATFGNAPTPRAFHATAVVNNSYLGVQMFVVGGSDGSRALSDIYSIRAGVNAWRLLNTGSTSPLTSFDGVRIQGVDVPGLMRHVCGGEFPIVLCVGGLGQGIATVAEYDIYLNRWLPSYTANPSLLPPIEGGKAVVRRNDETVSTPELWIVGGLTNAPMSYNYPRSILKTTLLTAPCPAGYVNPDYDGRCLRCASGSAMFFEKNPHRCQLCPPGTYEKYGECRLCPKSTYQPKNGTTNVTACLACPAGYFTITEGANGRDDCLTCPIGTYAVPNGCQKCPQGTRGIAAGKESYDAACTPCSFGSSSGPGATSCTSCPAGSSTGPFIERARPHRLTVRAMAVIPRVGSAPGNCPISGVLTQVTSMTWFYVILNVADYGSDGTTNPYNPINRAHLPPSITGRPDIFVEYEGNVPYMYYDCQDTSLVPSCTKLVVNQSSSLKTSYNLLPGCYTWQDYHLVIALRFDHATERAVVHIKSAGIIGIDLPLKVVAPGERVNITIVPNFYPRAAVLTHRYVALDLLMNFDPTSTDTFTIRAMCTTGVATPRFKLNGGAAATTGTLTFVNGTVTATTEVADESAGCYWFVTRSGVTNADATRWSSEQATSVFAVLGAENVTSGSVLNIYTFVRDSKNLTIAADNSTVLQLKLAPGRPYNNWIRIHEGGTTQQVVNGVARFVYHVTSTYPNKKQLVSGAFVLSVFTGPPGITPYETAKFYVAGRGNGTSLYLLTDRYPFPLAPQQNQTFWVEIQIRDSRGEVDGTRNPKIKVEVQGCPGVRVSLVNSSTPYFILGNGHRVVPLKLTQGDATNCRLYFKEVGYPAEKEARGVWSPPFTILSPHHLTQSSTCKLGVCGVGCIFEVGTRVNITVNVMSKSNELITRDQSTVIKMVVLGNASAAFETTGRPEKRVTDGVTIFEVEFRQSKTPLSLLFIPGFWTQRQVLNITYKKVPTFSAEYKKLGTALVHNPNSVLRISTCAITTTLSTTMMRVMNKLPAWVPNDEPFSIEIAATNSQGTIDDTYAAAFTVQIVNCYHGLMNDLTWSIMRDRTYTPVAFAAPDTRGKYAVVAGGTFSSGRARFKLIPKYTTQTNFTSGMKGCSVRISSGALTTLYAEGFEVRKVFPSCTLCPPGTWSGGGTGVSALTTYHVGGCAKCMMGTFSSTTGSTSESACQVCAKGYGYDFSGNYWSNYLQEGLTTCNNNPCAYDSPGLAGGGSCPAGNIAELLPTQATSLDPGVWGRLGRRCTLGQCNNIQTCPAGQFRLDCRDTFNNNPTTCNGAANKGYCLWNTSTVACEGTRYQCLPCPAGTVGVGVTYWPMGGVVNGNYACWPCNPGGWSTDEGHAAADTTDLQYEPYRCDGTFTYYQRLCTGAGTGQCWNGTASATSGAASNATCQTCPKGYYAHQVMVYERLNCVANCNPGLFVNPFYSYGCNGVIGGCWDCPLPIHTGTFVGARTCTPCPAGTYNNVTGRWDPYAHCIPCPAGTYCPAGTSEPLRTDTWNTQLDLSGTSMPQAVSFDRSEDTVTCSSAAISNHPGYVQDGRFSTFLLRNYRTVDTINKAYQQIWHNDPRHSYPYRIVARDRQADPLSGAALCNATGCEFYQTITLNHLVRSDYVARLWMFNALQRKNQTKYKKIMQPFMGSFDPFAGFRIRLYSHVNYSLAQTLDVTRQIPLFMNATNKWMSLEAKISPPWPVAFIQFNVSVRNYYLGYVLIDDAQFRPSRQRICNCSTGFYFNESRPSRPCMRCPPGFACSGGQLVRCESTWTVSAEPGCNHCRAGWQCDADGRGRSIPCATYTRKDNATETCSPCPLGYACQDGETKPCSGGTYGDGGIECVNCFPGYYSPAGPPVRECTRCPAGTMTNHMRQGCIDCPINHFSADGAACVECPVGSFAPVIRSGACTSCTALYLQSFNYTVYRNSENRLAVVPALCVEYYDWAVESIHHTAGASLAKVVASEATPDSVRYVAGPTVGNHTFRVFVTPALNEAIQRVDVVVHIQNRYPIVNDDPLTIAHPTTTTTMDLSFVLFNDYDPDTDNIFFANVYFSGAAYGSSNLKISSDRKHLTVDLPVGFTGPAVIAYTVMDQFKTTAAQCLPPACLFSWAATVTITAKDAPPKSTDDFFDVLNGRVYNFDVLANDTDPDNDDIDIVNVGTSTYGTTPTIAPVCTIGPACGSGTCQGISACTCAVDANRQLCWPSVGRRYTISYAAPATRCGTDSFQYTVRTNDGLSLSTVSARVRRCYCAAHPFGFNLAFLVDATTSPTDFQWQMAFVDAVQKRATSAAFNFALFGVGQSTRWQNLTSAYIPTEYIDPNTDGPNFPYKLAAALQQVGAGTATSVLGVPPATRRSVLVIVSGHESADSVISAGGQLALTYAAGGFKTIVVSVNPVGDHYQHARELNPLLKISAKDYATDLQNPQFAYDIMDEICSLP